MNLRKRRTHISQMKKDFAAGVDNWFARKERAT